MYSNHIKINTTNNTKAKTQEQHKTQATTQTQHKQTQNTTTQKQQLNDTINTHTRTAHNKHKNNTIINIWKTHIHQHIYIDHYIYTHIKNIKIFQNRINKGHIQAI